METEQIQLSRRETATILHGLRMVQEDANANGVGDCTLRYCDHFDEVDELNDTEIDALCEKLNCPNTFTSQTTSSQKEKE